MTKTCLRGKIKFKFDLQSQKKFKNMFTWQYAFKNILQCQKNIINMFYMSNRIQI